MTSICNVAISKKIIKNTEDILKYANKVNVRIINPDTFHDLLNSINIISFCNAALDKSVVMVSEKNKSLGKEYQGFFIMNFSMYETVDVKLKKIRACEIKGDHIEFRVKKKSISAMGNGNSGLCQDYDIPTPTMEKL